MTRRTLARMNGSLVYIYIYGQQWPKAPPEVAAANDDDVRTRFIIASNVAVVHKSLAPLWPLQRLILYER